MAKHQKILLVDDENDFLQLMTRILGNEGYHCSQAVSAADAAEILKHQQIDLCLLDIHMPGESGDHFLKELKQGYPDIAVIMSTGINSPDLAEKCAHYGADDYLVKPFEPERLIISMRNTLHRKRLQQENRFYRHQLERKLREQAEQLQASQSLLIQQEKLAAIGQLAAGVAHEINNPLGYISSNLSVLRKYAGRIADFCAGVETLSAQLPPDRQQEYQDLKKKQKLAPLLEDLPELLADSQDGLDRINKIVQSLKSFSRTDADEPQLFDVNECLESAITVVWNEIKYTAQLQRNLVDLPAVKGFPQQLAQVFMNILVNASHAIEANGLIEVASSCAADQVQVTIRDNGCGISADHLNKIFDPFFTTKPSGKGTGLGMSIAADIVHKHSGQLKVSSEPGKGTLFTVELPVATV